MFTSEREVNAMLDLVKHETERIDSRFLEPACGDGNFLSEILRRKLSIVESRYKQSSHEFDRYCAVAISSIYGVDLLKDNVEICRERLYQIFEDFYNVKFDISQNERLKSAIKYILSKNIICADALTLKNQNDKPVIFSEWSFVKDDVKRRDFTFSDLLTHQEIKALPLFSDLGEDVFLPTPIKEFPLTHFLDISSND